MKLEDDQHGADSDLKNDYSPLSTGWKLVSLRLSKPTPNSISGTEQEPKSPIPELDESEPVPVVLEATAVFAESEALAVAAASELSVAASVAEAELSDEVSPEPVPGTMLPWLSTDATAAGDARMRAMRSWNENELIERLLEY